MFPPGQQDADAPIRATDSDASLARLSAVKQGYLTDPFVKHFVSRAHLQLARPPLINIGTYVRSESIDRLVESWIGICGAEGRVCQIVSLGAGSDTRFWRLAAGKHSENIFKYIELDFSEVTTKKAITIKKNKDLTAALGDPGQIALKNGGTSLHSAKYHLLAADLRIPPSDALAPLLGSQNSESEPLLDCSVPTLLLFECVLAYMTPTASSAVIDWFTNYFLDVAPLGAIVYEMFGLEDAFGKVMKNNLRSRSVELPGVEPYTSFSSLPQRFSKFGFTFSHAATLKKVKDKFIPKDELSRIAKLEMLDEVEELNLVLDHYAITWGANLPNDTPQNWMNWDLKADVRAA